MMNSVSVRMAALAFLGVMLLFAVPAKSQRVEKVEEIPEKLSDWLVTPSPDSELKEYNATGLSRFHWRVVLDHHVPDWRVWNRDDEAKTETFLPFKPFDKKDWQHKIANQHTKRVADGWLVGYDVGEWGGDLWWFSPDGKRRYKISDDQVRGFLKTSAGLFAPTGMRHLSVDYGSLIKVQRNRAGRWQATLWADTKEVPRICNPMPDGSFLVVTSRQLLRVRVSGHLDVLVADAFWKYLDSTSAITTPNGDIYIGMQHGIARVRKAGGKYLIEWLLPNKEFLPASVSR